MKKKISLRKTVKNFTILFIVIFIIAFTIRKFNESPEKWVSVESGYISISTQHKALLVLDEIVYKTLNSGYIQNNQIEGERIKKGQVICDFISTSNADNDSSNKLQENTNLDGDIEIEEFASIDTNQIKLDTQKLYKDLKQALIDGDDIKAKKYKRELIYTLEHLNKLENNDFFDEEEFESRNKYIGSNSAEIEQHFNVISSESGVVSYYIDELSGKLSYDNRYKLNYDKLLNKNYNFTNTLGENLQGNTKAFKIIYKQKWHLLCESSLEDLDTYKVDDKLSVLCNGKSFGGIISDKFKSKNKGIICLEISEVDESIYKSRILNITIIRDQMAGIIIPENAIVTQDYIKGVYVKGADGEKIFRPIQILGSKEKGLIVSQGTYNFRDSSGNIDTIDTVNSSDSVLIIDK